MARFFAMLLPERSNFGLNELLALTRRSAIGRLRGRPVDCKLVEKLRHMYQGPFHHFLCQRVPRMSPDNHLCRDTPCRRLWLARHRPLKPRCRAAATHLGEQRSPLACEP